MMAAFIVAIRGTVTQAALLGLSATLSHTAVVWAVAMAGLYFGRNWNAEATESYFQVASAVLIIGVALWMTLVLCFSMGLAMTMVASGALAALSVKHVSKRWSGFGAFARKAPLFFWRADCVGRAVCRLSRFPRLGFSLKEAR